MNPTPMQHPGPSAAPNRILLAGLALCTIFLCSVAGWIAYDQLKAPKSLAEVEKLVTRRAWASAEKQLGRYLAGHPNEPQALMLQARLLAAEQYYDRCARVLEQIPADAPERAEALRRAGEAWQEGKQRREAERVWRACLELPAGELELPSIQQASRRHLCNLFALERRHDDLWAMTAELLEHSPPRQRHEPLAMRVRYEFEMVQPLVALGLLESALKINPADPLTRRAIGLYHLEAGETEKARSQLYQCVQENRENPIMWEAWLQCLYKTADMFGLEDAIRSLPVSADQSAECWKFRGIMAEQKGELDRAIADHQRAIELRPSEPENHHRLGQLLLRTGKKSEAQEHLAKNQELQQAQQELRQAYDEYRNNYAAAPQARRIVLAFRLAEGYEKLGRAPEALAWYRVVLAENPSHLPSIQVLERLQNSAALRP